MACLQSDLKILAVHGEARCRLWEPHHTNACNSTSNLRPRSQPLHHPRRPPIQNPPRKWGAADQHRPHSRRPFIRVARQIRTPHDSGGNQNPPRKWGAPNTTPSHSPGLPSGVLITAARPGARAHRALRRPRPVQSKDTADYPGHPPTHDDWLRYTPVPAASEWRVPSGVGPSVLATGARTRRRHERGCSAPSPRSIPIHGRCTRRESPPQRSAASRHRRPSAQRACARSHDPGVTGPAPPKACHRHCAHHPPTREDRRAARCRTFETSGKTQAADS